MIRKLATIRKISEIRPIEGADSIELAIVDGWQVVIRKGEFKAGDAACYMELDSFLPIRPEFEFLRKSSYRKMADSSEGFRLKTVRLRGALSQGLLVPLSSTGLERHSLGEDVTDLLGIKKYEAPIPACLNGDAKGKLPGFIKYTDQERIQNLPDYFDRFRDMYFEATEKIDGSSASYFFNNGEFGVGGHNYEYLDTPNNTYWKVAKQLNIQESLSRLGRNLALQGEIHGEGIQKNRYKLIGQSIRIFDIWDIDKQYYLTRDERLGMMRELGLGISKFHVPEIEEPFQVFNRYPTTDALLEYAKGKSMLSEYPREGVVFKSIERVGPETKSFKVINNDFLLGEKD